MTTTRGEAIEGFIDALVDDDAEQLYDRAPCGYLSTLPDGTIVKANQTFLSLTGFNGHEIIGRQRFVDLLSPGGRIYYESHYAPMLRMQGSAREIALDLVRADGTRLPVLVNSVLDLDADNAPRLIRTAVFDATERRAYERELLLEKERAEASEARATALAQTLQQTLIPPDVPQIPMLDVAARYRPAGSGDEVGGDFYDVFQTGPHSWVIVIGDVRGKGVDAAIVTALARHTLRAASMTEESPVHALAVLNEVLCREEERFCTVGVVRLDHRDGGWQAVVCSAGHPLPLHRRGASLSTLGEPGPLLGVFESGVELSAAAVSLAPGDVVLLYTDGVPDGRSGAAFYGESRMNAVLANDFSDADDVVQSLLDSVLEFQGGRARDDIAIVAIRVPF